MHGVLWKCRLEALNIISVSWKGTLSRKPHHVYLLYLKLKSHNPLNILIYFKTKFLETVSVDHKQHALTARIFLRLIYPCLWAQSQSTKNPVIVQSHSDTVKSKCGTCTFFLHNHMPSVLVYQYSLCHSTVFATG